MRILVVEDEPEVADIVQRALREVAWAPDVVHTVREAERALAVVPYDLVVLDRGLPDGDGVDVCRRYRERGGGAGVLVLTARGDLADRVEGLDSGADDYLPKPFAVEELLARLRALSRRPPEALDVVLRYADLELDLARCQARLAGETLTLSARELALLEYLLRNPERVLSRSQILDHVWDDGFEPVGNVVDVLVGRLRRRLERGGPLIHTVRGLGYVLSSQRGGS